MNSELMSHGALTPKAVAEEFGIPRSRLFNLIRDGVLPRVKLSSRRILIPRASLEEFLAKHLQPAPAKSA